MKRIMKTLALVAVAAMGLTACQNEYDDEQIVVNDSVVVTFVADAADDTRTSVDTSDKSKPVFAWGDNETFAVLEQTDALAEATSVTFTKEDGKAKIEAEFATNADKGSYNYVTVYPESGYIEAESIEAVTLSLPAAQTMAEGSYDPAADLMVSEVVTTNAQPTEAQMVGFTRLAAVAKMTFTNFSLEAGDAVESVTFTAEGKVLAGTFTADLAAPAVAEAEGSNSVTVATTSTGDVYFTVLPTIIAVGDSFTVTVVTNRHLYIKEVTIDEGKKPLEFQAGNVTLFGVNMSGVTPYDRWELVTDASTLAEGDIVTIAAKDYDKAISTKLYNNASETSTIAKRGLADVTKIDNFLIGGEDLQALTLMTGVAANTFSFYDETRGKFLVSSTTGSTYLINQAYCDVNTSFAITIDDTTAAATITNTEGAYKGNLLRYNSNGYFTSNQNESSVYKDVCIYRLEGAVGEIPTVAAVVTVPDSDESVTIAEEGTAEATTIEAVVFNYVGAWTISASANAEWLTPAYDAVNNCLTYTAEKNNDAKREATITITATLEGQDAITWTVNVTQKGAPQDTTIAEFIALESDPNSTYRLTGKVVTCATNATTSGYFLADENGNQAKIVYLKTENDENVWGHDNITLQLGDIVTVTAVPAGNETGGSKTNPAIYKGHYRLTATAGIAADYTGGDVTIDVETSSNGNVTLPTTPVKGTMSDYDFADFAYTDGSDTATVTFNSENTTSEAREAEVTFTYGLASATVVAQQGINPANKKGFELVTDASDLTVGDEVIIVAKNADRALACPASTSQTTSPSAAIIKTGNVIYDVEEAGVQVLTLGAGLTEGTMSFELTYNNNGYRLYYSSGLKLRTTTYAINAATSWTIEIADDGDATITSTRLIKFNEKGANGGTFGTYSTTATQATADTNKVCIYKKQK